jgi:uncharacterized protein YdeI (YjbR/CyaY-like superfamily)
MTERTFKSSSEWRRWLAENHRKERGIWLVFYKKSSGKGSIDYDSALDEALCYGWIDSILKRIDDHRYTRKFTPRQAGSSWSPVNKKKVSRLLRQKRVRAAGLRAIRLSKQSGGWEEHARPRPSFRVPKPFLVALGRSPKAHTHFKNLAVGYQRRFVLWIAMAKRPDTQQKRIRESIRLLEKNQKLGLK